MKKAILLFFLLFFAPFFAQEKSNTLKLDLNKSANVFQIVDEPKKQVSIFYHDSYAALAIKLDENFKIIDSLTGDKPDIRYDELIGYSNQGNNYFTYWFNSYLEDIATLKFDFESRKTEINYTKFDLKKEKIVHKVTINNIFYIITSVRASNILNCYQFENENFTKKTIDLSSFRFVNSEQRQVTLFDVFKESFFIDSAFVVQNISSDSPASLAFSASKKKVYTIDNKLLFTFDGNNSFTQTILIDLTNFTATQKTYLKPFIDETELSSNINSNSFYFDKNIVHLKSDSNRMIISFKDLEGNELKEYRILAAKELKINNSDIIQENGSIQNTSIFDKTDDLVSKINNNNPSLSCYKIQDKIILTLGSVSPAQDNNAMMYGAMVGGLTGVIIGAAISSSYTMNNINSYKGRKVVYINCLFDNNFNHVAEELQSLAFDKLRFFDSKNDKLEVKTIFKFQSDLYYGGYNSKTKEYSFYKFSD